VRWRKERGARHPGILEKINLRPSSGGGRTSQKAYPGYIGSKAGKKETKKLRLEKVRAGVQCKEKHLPSLSQEKSTTGKQIRKEGARKRKKDGFHFRSTWEEEVRRERGDVGKKRKDWVGLETE